MTVMEPGATDFQEYGEGTQRPVLRAGRYGDVEYGSKGATTVPGTGSSTCAWAPTLKTDGKHTAPTAHSQRIAANRFIC